MSNEYVEKRDDGLWIRASRVSLDSLVYAFRDGLAPETIVKDFPALSLEQVYGAIAYYLAHQEAVDEHLETTRRQFEQDRLQERAADPAFYRRIAALRQHRTAG